MRLLASTAAATHSSNRSRPSARQRFMPRPRNNTEMRPSMPARKRWPSLNSRLFSYASRSGVLVPPRCGMHTTLTPSCLHDATLCSLKNPRSPPHLYGGDRGFFGEHNVASCKQDGVKVVCIPQRGGTKTPEREAYEKSREFKDGQRFRAGIEGRISVLFRGRGMKRCLAEGRERFELWVAAAVLANNLMKIAALLTDRSLRRRKAA